MKYTIAPTNDYIAHSTGPWKKHKYIKKIGKRYVYAKDQYNKGMTNAKYKMMYGHRPTDPVRQKTHPYSVGKSAVSGYALNYAFSGSRIPVVRQRSGLGGALLSGGIAAAGNAYQQHKLNKQYRAEKRQLKKELREAKATSLGGALVAMGKRIVSKIAGIFKKNK